MTEEERKEKRKFYNVMNASKRNAYNKATYKGIYVRFHKEKDASLIEHLAEIPNVNDYIRQLIVADLRGS